MRTADELAAWVSTFADVGEPRVSVNRVAGHFGVPVVIDEAIDQVGMLRLLDGRPSIVVQGGPATRRRFTAAHELGHFLLAGVEGVPLTEQVGETKYERFCNKFASHLLLPRGWLEEQSNAGGQRLSTVMEIADSAGCSLMAVVVALNEKGRWNHPLIRMWKGAASEWLVASLVGPSRCQGLLSISGDSQCALDGVGRRPMVRQMVMDWSGVEVSMEMEVVRYGRLAYAMPRTGWALQSDD